jgi:phage regulator Rha-like protein
MELTLNSSEIKTRIFSVRGFQVMLDSHLAEIYQIETKNLNKAVSRNIDRFPQTFQFQLSKEEWEILKFQIGTSSERHGGRRYLPYVFTEQGVAMLSAVIKNEIAIQVSIQIINAFVEMRKVISANNLIDLRFGNIEKRLFETDQKLEQVFKALEDKELKPVQQGIFFEGQIFDAYSFVSDIIRSAKQSIQLLDNYIDDTVLTLLAKREKNVSATIYTQKIDKKLELDVQKHNQQYPHIKLSILANVHDRFLLIDEKELYHIGASLKDLGKKWFAFSKMNDFTREVLKRINP